MKKPNISKGEWEVVKNNEVMIHRVYSEGAYVTGGLRKQDAKAISAVPDMIDALISIIELHKRCSRHAQFSLGMESRIREAKNALKKAGCTE